MNPCAEDALVFDLRPSSTFAVTTLPVVPWVHAGPDVRYGANVLSLLSRLELGIQYRWPDMTTATVTQIQLETPSSAPVASIQATPLVRPSTACRQRQHEGTLIPAVARQEQGQVESASAGSPHETRSAVRQAGLRCTETLDPGPSLLASVWLQLLIRLRSCLVLASCPRLFATVVCVDSFLFLFILLYLASSLFSPPVSLVTLLFLFRC
ncbi:hypothetical protein BR93DRAFT_220951 [Coniochaeta sp. PMI_546]|nr:hypothetical protein BR93DRAFT_220951 [Coniochaeta sp. PMI_546]